MLRKILSIIMSARSDKLIAPASKVLSGSLLESSEIQYQSVSMK
jgi:hypothetical protein